MKVRLSAEGFELSTELDKYANRKVAQMLRNVPRKEKADAVCELQFSQTAGQEIKLSTCTVTVTLGDVELRAEETTQHMYAALDIAAVRIEQQVTDYATRHRHGLRGRLKRHFGSAWNIE